MEDGFVCVRRLATMTCVDTKKSLMPLTMHAIKDQGAWFLESSSWATRERERSVMDGFRFRRATGSKPIITFLCR